jgi:hypothetical protein
MTDFATLLRMLSMNDIEKKNSYMFKVLFDEYIVALCLNAAMKKDKGINFKCSNLPNHMNDELRKIPPGSFVEFIRTKNLTCDGKCNMAAADYNDSDKWLWDNTTFIIGWK